MYWLSIQCTLISILRLDLLSVIVRYELFCKCLFLFHRLYHTDRQQYYTSINSTNYVVCENE